MSLVARIVRASGIAESDIRSITEMESVWAYEVRLWNRRRRVVSYQSVLAQGVLDLGITTKVIRNATIV